MHRPEPTTHAVPGNGSPSAFTSDTAQDIRPCQNMQLQGKSSSLVKACHRIQSADMCSVTMLGFLLWSKQHIHGPLAVEPGVGWSLKELLQVTWHEWLGI